MDKLKERILAEGKVISDDIIKVDTFLNNQVDPSLMKEIGICFSGHFAGRGITKVITIESSGISPALMTAYEMGIPLVVLKKHSSRILSPEVSQTEVTSYTTGNTYEMTLSAGLITENDHVLLIDDFLADGEAVTGALRLIRKAHATVGGIGIVIEKTFQPGSSKLKDSGIEVYSLAKISSLADKQIIFEDQD